MTLTHSDQLDQIATALAKAQGEIEAASKSAINPHFRSKYADLSSVWDAIRGPLSKHGLAVVQVPCSEGARIGIETLLIHASGQWIRGLLSVTAKDEGAQAAGSCITYLRRYALQSFAGVAPEDDDGNKAGIPAPQATAEPAKSVVPAGYQDWLDDFTAAADEGTEKIRQTWQESRLEFRNYLTKQDIATYNALKARAADADKRITVGA